MDNKSKVGTPDRNLINVNESYELSYWAEKFGVKPQQLKDAVKAVGTSAKEVEAHLKK